MVEEYQVIPQESPQLAVAPKEMDADLVRHVIDSNPQRASFYGMFASWREESEEEIYKDSLGKPKKRIITRLKIGENRLCNEAGADFLFEYVYGLISPATATSKANALEIYNAWHGTVRMELPWTLLKKIRNEGNPYNMKISSIPQVVSALAKLYLIGKKTEDGWMYDLTSKQYSSQLVMHAGSSAVVNEPPKKRGLLSAIWG